MAKVLITEDYLSDIADAIREKKSSEDTYTPAEMADAIESIQTGTAPTGTISISTNGIHDVTDYANASVSVPTGTARSSSDLTASNLTVTAPAGLYAENATKTLSDQNLVAGNIKKDVTIFGTTGTYEGGGGGGGIPQGTYVSLGAEVVTVGANSVTNGLDAATYLLGLTSADSPTIWFYVLAESYTPFNNMSYGSVLTTNGASYSIDYGSTSRRFYRYNSGTIAEKLEGSGFDCSLQSGMKYLVVWAKQGAWS